MCLRSQAGTADPASHWQAYPAGLRGAAAPGQPVQASGLSGKWKFTCSGGAICTEHPWLLYSCSFSSCSSLRSRLPPLVPDAAGVCRLLCSGLHQAHLGPSAGEKHPGGAAGMLQADSQQRAGHGRSWLWEQSAWCRTWSLPASSGGCCSMWLHFRGSLSGRGRTIWQNSTLKLLENCFILYSHTTDQKF